MPISLNPSVFQTAQRPDAAANRELREPAADERKEKRPDNENAAGKVPASLQTDTRNRGVTIKPAEAAPLTANRTQERERAAETTSRNLNNGERDIGRLVDISV